MRHPLAFAVVLIAVIGILASDTFAQRPPAVNDALRGRYGDRTTHIEDSEVINGVRVYHVRIANEAGTGSSTAEIAENGDFLYSGIPASFGSYPEPVRQLQQIFNTRVQNVETIVVTEYHVDLDVAGGTHRLRFDPVGRVQDLVRPEQLKRDADAPELGDEAPGELRNRLQESVRRYYPDAELSTVRQHPTNPNLYTVELKGDAAENTRIVFTREGHLYLRSEEIPVDKLPDPARQTVEKTFGDRVKIQQAARSQHELYQFAQQTAGEDLLVFRVRPDGEVISVRPLSAEEDRKRTEALTRLAGERARPDGEKPEQDKEQENKDNNKD